MRITSIIAALALTAALLCLPGPTQARDKFTSGVPTIHKAWEGTVTTSGVLVNVAGYATTADPEDEDNSRRSHYIMVCNRSTTAGEKIHVNTGNPTSTGTVDKDNSTDGIVDPPVGGDGSKVCVPFDDALLFQIELASVTGSPVATVFYGYR